MVTARAKVKIYIISFLPKYRRIFSPFPKRYLEENTLSAFVAERVLFKCLLRAYGL